MDSKSATMLFALVVFLLMIQLNSEMGTSTTVHGQDTDCNKLCSYRCSKASRHKLCMRACNSCCERCHCVPPGTSGNKDVCPCYANMTTHGGKPKCP